LKNDNFEAARMWSIGKELGFSFNGDEEIVISKLKSLENRDRTAGCWEGEQCFR